MNVEVKDSGDTAKGVFAATDFSAGDKILNITGDVIETAHPENYPEDIREHWGPLGKQGNIFRFITPEQPWF